MTKALGPQNMPLSVKERLQSGSPGSSARGLPPGPGMDAFSGTRCRVDPFLSAVSPVGVRRVCQTVE